MKVETDTETAKAMLDHLNKSLSRVDGRDEQAVKRSAILRGYRDRLKKPTGGGKDDRRLETAGA